jgi:hypothetical protein
MSALIDISHASLAESSADFIDAVNNCSTANCLGNRCGGHGFGFVVLGWHS